MTEQIWRPRKASMLYFTCIALFVAIALMVVAVGQNSRGGELAFVIAIAVTFLLALYLEALRPRIVLRDAEVEVRNVLTETIPLAQISDVAVGVWGILLRKTDGSTTTARAVMKLTFRPQWSAAADPQRSERFGRPVLRNDGRRRRADEVVEAISEAAQRATVLHK